MTRRVLIAIVLAACGKSSAPEQRTPPPPPAKTDSGVAADAPVAPVAPVEAGPPALDVKGMDRSVKPGDDFYAFSNGAWTKATEIPADRSAWGTGIIVVETTEKRLAGLISDATKAAAGSDAKKVGDYYTAYMDTATIEKKGFGVLKPELDAIAAISDAKSLARAIGGTLRADVDATNNTNFETTNLFGLWIAADLNDPTKYVTYVMQGGLGLPDRDYYTSADAHQAEIRDKYKAHVAKVLTLAGVSEPDAAAAKILALETSIAKVHATRVESEDVKNGTLRWKKADFAKNAPGLDWDALFEAAGLADQAQFGNWHPKAISGVAALVKSTPLDTWKAYLSFHLIDRMSGVLPDSAVQEQFAFYGTTLAGVPKMRDRAKRAIGQTQAALGWPLGKLYVDKYFPPEAKTKITEMVKNIIAAFDRRIDGLAWMAPATKAKAKAKLATLKIGVGYPDKWRDYGKLVVTSDDAFGNAERASKFEYEWNLAKLGQPVDRDEWVMVPELVNAVNLPALNAMNFPAAILQAPFFDPSRPEPLDYGAIGAVIGHEISHSFDDQGAKFDETGRYVNWWTKEDFQKFSTQGKALIAQYDAYKPFPDLALKGEQTLSENIADVAGLAIAFDAYKASGKQAPVLDGLTSDQQFYVSFAQSWRNKAREAITRRRILTDGHSPGEYRAATVRNLDGWYQAFDVKPDAKLYLAPDVRVHIW